MIQKSNCTNSAINYYKQKKVSYNSKRRPRSRLLSKTHNIDTSKMEYLNIPGFNHLFRSGGGWLYKFIWFVILSICIAFTTMQSVYRIDYFFSRPVANEIILHHNSANFTFPAITVCFLSFYKVFWAKLDRKFSKNRTQSISAEDIEKLWNETYDAYIVKTYVACTAARNATDDICGKRRVLEVNWTREYVLTAMGGCIGLRESLDPTVVLKTGFIRLSVQHTEEAMVYHKKNVSDMEFRPAGFYYYLHSKEWNPNSYYSLHRQRPVRLGEEIGLDIFIRSFEFINSSHVVCDNELIVEECWRKCFHGLIKKNTECSLPHLKLFNSLKPCESLDSIKDTCKAIYAVGMDGGPKGCGCVRSCRLIVYGTSLYSVDKSGVEGKSVTTFRPDTLQEEYRDFLSYDRSALFSDLGGTMGLYLGLCVFTYIEVIELIITLVWDYCKMRIYRKLSKQKTQVVSIRNF